MSNILTSFDPSTGEIVGKVQITEVELIPQIVEKARIAQKEWGKLTVDERIQYIDKAAKLLSEKSRELGILLSREMGKDLNRGIGEVEGCAYDAVYRAKQVKDVIKTQVFIGYGMETHLEYNPIGVCAVITPWNYPISMAHWLIISALTAGNTVVRSVSQ